MVRTPNLRSEPKRGGQRALGKRLAIYEPDPRHRETASESNRLEMNDV
jgi:hypothetical protein